MFLFFVTVAFSAYYIIERLVQLSLTTNSLVLVCVGLVAAIVLLFSVWSASLFVLKMLLQRFIPHSRVKSKLRQVLHDMNDRIFVKGIASTLFGVDTNDSEGGTVIRINKTDGGRDTNNNIVSNDELLIRMERLETLLLDRTLEKRDGD